MKILWLEDNLSGVAELYQQIKSTHDLTVKRHVNEAVIAVTDAANFYDMFIVDVMLPMGGRTIHTELQQFLSEYSLAANTEYAGAVFAHWIAVTRQNSKILILSDFLEKGKQVVDKFEQTVIIEVKAKYDAGDLLKILQVLQNTPAMGQQQYSGGRKL